MHPGLVSEEVSPPGKQRGPKQDRRQVEAHKGSVVHLADPGHKRHEGADDGDELAENDRHGPVA